MRPTDNGGWRHSPFLGFLLFSFRQLMCTADLSLSDSDGLRSEYTFVNWEIFAEWSRRRQNYVEGAQARPWVRSIFTRDCWVELNYYKTNSR